MVAEKYGRYSIGRKPTICAKTRTEGGPVKSWLSRLLRRIGRFRSDSDLEDELRAHLEMQAEDNLAGGMPAVEARRRARLRLGRTPAIIERVHDQDFMTILESWYRDFVLGMRAIRKSPVFCVTAILTLALGIGANTAIFALLYGLLLRSLPVSDPEQLQREQHSFSAISAWWLGEVTMLDSEGTLRAYHVGLVSGNAFPMFGMKP